jgi:hypothetical protein
MWDSSPINSWVPFLSALGGGLVSGLSAFAIHWSNKKSEERKHLNTLTINAAIENWKQINDAALAHAKEGIPATVLPLEAFIIHMMKITDVFINEKITKENAPDKLKEVYEITSLVDKYIKERDAKQGSNQPVHSDAPQGGA